MIQLVRRRINSSVAFNKCGSSFPAAQAANRKEAQQESKERSECVFARFKPASRKTLAARSLSFSLSASEDSACSPPTVILALTLFMLQRQVSGRNGQYSTSSARSNTVKGEMEEWTSGGREVQAESSREKRWQMGTWGEACNAHVIAAWLHGLGTRSFSFGLLSGSKARLFSENKLKYPPPDQTPSGPVKNQGSVSNREDQSETGSRRRRRRPKQRQRKGKVIKDDGFETWHPAIQGSSGETMRCRRPIDGAK